MDDTEPERKLINGNAKEKLLLYRLMVGLGDRFVAARVARSNKGAAGKFILTQHEGCNK